MIQLDELRRDFPVLTKDLFIDSSTNKGAGSKYNPTRSYQSIHADPGRFGFSSEIGAGFKSSSRIWAPRLEWIALGTPYQTRSQMGDYAP